jgi:hypothetical protein
VLSEAVPLDEAGAKVPVSGVEDAHGASCLAGECGEKRRSDGVLEK